MFRFISAEKLKERSIINGNVDNKLLLPIIDECQEFYILPILGTQLYNEIGSQLPSSLTVDNKKLLDDYIIPCLVKYVQYEAPIYLNYKFTNANVSTKNTDESAPIDMATSSRLMDMFKDKAEWYGERIVRYLCANRSVYPLYCVSNNSDDIKPSDTAYDCGIYLD